jgi:hypothetical protein
MTDLILIFVGLVSVIKYLHHQTVITAATLSDSLWLKSKPPENPDMKAGILVLLTLIVQVQVSISS